MAMVPQREITAFTDAIFGTDEEIREGSNSQKPRIRESIIVEGTLFSKNRWSVEEEKNG